MASNGEHFGDRHKAILAAAAKVFDAHGYAATTMEAVAAEAGISKGSIYNYFKNKDDLFAQVFSEAMAGGITRAEQVLAAPLTAAAKLDRLLGDWARQLEYYKRIGRLMLEFWVTAARQEPDGTMANWFDHEYGEWRRVVRAILSQGVAVGEFRGDLDVASHSALIVALVDGLTVQAILDMNKSINEEFIADARRAILAVLSAPSGADVE